MSKLALGFDLAVTEARNSGRLLENIPAFRGSLGADYVVDLTLPDHRISIPAQTGIHKQFMDILQSNRDIVQSVFTFTRAVISAGDGNIVLIHRKIAFLVVDYKGDLSKAKPLSCGGSAEDNVFHSVASQGLIRLLTENPTNRIGYVALTRAVRANDGCDAFAKLQHSLVCERLEPLNFNGFESQSFTSSMINSSSFNLISEQTVTSIPFDENLFILLRF